MLEEISEIWITMMSWKGDFIKLCIESKLSVWIWIQLVTPKECWIVTPMVLWSLNFWWLFYWQIFYCAHKNVKLKIWKACDPIDRKKQLRVMITKGKPNMIMLLWKIVSCHVCVDAQYLVGGCWCCLHLLIKIKYHYRKQTQFMVCKVFCSSVQIIRFYSFPLFTFKTCMRNTVIFWCYLDTTVYSMIIILDGTMQIISYHIWQSFCSCYLFISTFLKNLSHSNNTSTLEAGQIFWCLVILKTRVCQVIFSISSCIFLCKHFKILIETLKSSWILSFFQINQSLIDKLHS